jgi:hypothetical protein
LNVHVAEQLVLASDPQMALKGALLPTCAAIAAAAVVNTPFVKEDDEFPIVTVIGVASAEVAAPANTNAARRHPVLLNIKASCEPSRRSPMDAIGFDACPATGMPPRCRGFSRDVLTFRQAQSAIYPSRRSFLSAS